MFTNKTIKSKVLNTLILSSRNNKPKLNHKLNYKKLPQIKISFEVIVLFLINFSTIYLCIKWLIFVYLGI